MKSIRAKAEAFHEMHHGNRPLVLYNIWDAGSAKAVLGAGAGALATGSWSVAASQGFPDGEQLPLSHLIATVKSIVDIAANTPVSVDFEGGYAVEPDDVAGNVAKLLNLGAVGINFEDRVVTGTGLYDIEMQARRIRAIRAMADTAGIKLFINTRTDLFLEEANGSKHAGLVDEAVARARSYIAAGGDGFFVPGLTDIRLIERICGSLNVPVNTMVRSGVADLATLSKAGVARVSYGPGPYREAMTKLENLAKSILRDMR